LSSFEHRFDILYNKNESVGTGGGLGRISLPRQVIANEDHSPTFKVMLAGRNSSTGCSKQVTVELLGLIDVRHRKDDLVEPQGHVILRRSSS
jgi:hypothetical protein